MTHPSTLPAHVDDELDLLTTLLPLDGLHIIELGCGQAALARALLTRHPGSRLTALEVDVRQHAKNLAAPPQAGLRFVAAGAQAIPFEDGSFDLALMLKSLHHVPLPLMAQALGEVARVLRPGGHLYVSEPVYDGPLNDIMCIFHDEGQVRAAAQAALDAALQSGHWRAAAEHRFLMPVRFADFADFEQRMMRPTYAEHDINEHRRERVRLALEAQAGPAGLHFERPMHLRLLQRAGA